MRLLLDTHIWIWLVSDDSKLPGPYAVAIAAPENTVVVSVASVCEFSIKQRTGKLETALSVDRVIRGLEGAEWLPIGLEHVRRLHDLPLIHRDPFDRILVAQALTDGLTLLTVDSVIPQYGVSVLATT